MKLAIYQLDAFTDKLFAGNPAAVVPLEYWLPDDLLQRIAAENNLAETAYYVKGEEGYQIRWFTPATEVDLCGHATLAAAYVVFNYTEKGLKKVAFDSRSGVLNVEEKEEGWFALDFPADSYHIAVPPPALNESLAPLVPNEVYRGKMDYMVVLDSENEVRSLDPDIIILSTIPTRGIIVTAPADASGAENIDFVSRFFAPQSGIDEDPVTGSAHTTLIPYWAKRLDKQVMSARQVSARGGVLRCRLMEGGERVEIAGQIRLYMTGVIETE